MSHAAPGLSIARTVAALRERVAAWRAERLTVGLIPTMGALHEGHLSLVRAALAQCDRAVATIFVNPKQFGPKEDFAAYPRDEAADAAKLAGAGAHLLFTPSVAEMYPDGHATTVSVGSPLTEGLCGPFRPGHFAGVATVVSKLLLQALPDRAYFGEKDWQQLQVVKRFARDLDIPVAIEGVPTMREGDGLAMSSRNAYMSAGERRVAAALPRLMNETARRIAAGDPAAPALEAMSASLTSGGFTAIDYVTLADGATLRGLDRAAQGARLFAAAWIGRTRLIDNIPVPPVGAP
ncbi:MAG: pantoate--beta-alanine ligase [Alphaproteobacteria bacterium]|nr:pantoate--beta-alanine ligase [Alphaproteobacteria bacterium]